jgi:hypothetical protein
VDNAPIKRGSGAISRMKTRIMAFLALITIALVWHFFLIRNKSLAPTAQSPDPDLTLERTPATQDLHKTNSPPGAQLHYLIMRKHSAKI